jgi:hypothetical protein
MPTQACLDAIKRKQPPGQWYCNDRIPGHCDAIQGDINETCEHLGLGSDVPYPQNIPGVGKCYCCCSCFAYGTPIEVEPQAYKLIEHIAVGETVLATDASVSEWKPRKVTELGGIAPEFQVDFMLFGRFRMADGTLRHLITSADHLFLLPDRRLRPMQDLRPGDELRQADGGIAAVDFVTWIQFSGGVRHLALGEWRKGEPLDGHLVNANGLVTTDLSVQLSHYGGGAVEHLAGIATDEDRPPIGSTAFFARYDTRSYSEFVNDPDAWPAGVRALSRTLLNIPVSALAYFSQEQAEDIQRSEGAQNLGDSASLALTRYLFKTCGAWYPDLYFIVDWANELPNAWYFIEYEQRFVVLSGGLVRLPELQREGLAIILSHLVAQSRGHGCTGPADYHGVALFLNEVWRDELWFETFDLGYPQLVKVFDRILPEHAGEDPDNICRRPSIACRKETLQSATHFGGVPECAKPAPDFAVTGARAENLTDVVVTFNHPVNVATATNPASYRLDPAATVLAVEAKDREARLNVQGLRASRAYELRVENVISDRGRPLSPGHATATFHTP